MAIIHIEQGRVSTTAWLVRIALCTAVGVALGAVWVHGTESRAPLTPSATPPNSSCCSTVGTKVVAESAALPGVAHRLAAEREIRNPEQIYREAQRFVDCLALHERDVQGVKSALEEMYAVDPTSPAIGQLQRDEQLAREACRAVGPNDTRRIDALMHEAAQRGSPDAKFFLLERAAQAEIDRVSALRADLVDTDAGALTVDAQAEAAVTALEKLALEGHRPAMVRTSELLSGNLLVAAQPIRAVAWRIVALQVQLNVQLAQQELDDRGLLSGVGAEDAARVMIEVQRLAASLGHQVPTRTL